MKRLSYWASPLILGMSEAAGGHREPSEAERWEERRLAEIAALENDIADPETKASRLPLMRRRLADLQR